MSDREFGGKSQPSLDTAEDFILISLSSLGNDDLSLPKGKELVSSSSILFMSMSVSQVAGFMNLPGPDLDCGCQKQPSSISTSYP